MNKKIIISIFIILFSIFSKAHSETTITFDGPVFLGEVPFYFGIGTGKLFINGETITDIKGNDNNYVIDDPLYITFGMEGPINENFHVGAEIGFFTQTARPRNNTDPEFRHELLDFLLFLKYFPNKDSGFFTKFGFGWCLLDSVEDEPDPADDDIHDDYEGYTAKIGIGYELVGEKFHAGITLEYSTQRYNDDYDQSGTLIDNSDIRSDLVTLAVRIGWY